VSEQSRLSRIFELCLSIEHRALTFYRELASGTLDAELGALWKEMARDEAQHMAYWGRLLEMSRAGDVPEPLDKPEELEAFLLDLLPKIDELAARVRKDTSSPDVLVLALRLEFHLLEPRFQSLFHCLYNLPERQNPEEDYEIHLRRLMTTLNRHSESSPMLALLIETIERIWKVNMEAIHSSQLDHLTGLLNRRGIAVAMRPLTYLARRNGHPVGVMMIDLDDFKAINDTFGHPAGDKVLVLVTQLMRCRLRASDIVGRYGGEEFLAVLTPTDPQHLAEIAENLRRAVEANPIGEIHATISIGTAYAVLRDDVEKDLDELIHQADQALLKAKRAGKNRVVNWSPGINNQRPAAHGTDYSRTL